MDNRIPLVSVRIPSYNHEDYIYDCINSVLNQTFQNFEIIIVDDGSTDLTVDIIRRFNDKRISLSILERNSGTAFAVEKCLEHCRGKYIANLCSDDMWEKTKLEKQVEFLENNEKYDAVFTQVDFINETGKSMEEADNKYSEIFDYKNRNSMEWLRRFFHQGNCLCIPSVLIKKEVYDSLNYQDKRMASLSDFDLWVRFSMNHELWILDEKLTMFRIRNNDMNLSADTLGNRNRGAFELKQILNNYLLLKSAKFLIEILPECLKFGKPQDWAIPYFLGRVALEPQNSFLFHLWGAEKIFDLLGDPIDAQNLEKEYDFRYVDFHNITKSVNFFNASPLEEIDKVIETETMDSKDIICSLAIDLENKSKNISIIKYLREKLWQMIG